MRPERSHPAARGIRSTLVGVAANFVLACVKAAAGYLGRSYALVADAVESFLDVFSSLIVVLGLRVAAAPPDEEHPYGHGKAEPLAAMVVSMMLLLAAFAIARQSLREIASPHLTPAPFTLAILVIVVATKELLFRFVFSVGEAEASTAVKADAWHHRSDALTSAAAFVGISISLVGGPGYESADDWAALLASGVIAYNAYRLFRPALAEVMDTAPPLELPRRVKEVAARVEGVSGVGSCLVRKMGFDLYVDLHIGVDPAMAVREAHRIAHRVKAAIQEAMPRVRGVLVHVEPHDSRNKPERPG